MNAARSFVRFDRSFNNEKEWQNEGGGEGKPANERTFRDSPEAIIRFAFTVMAAHTVNVLRQRSYPLKIYQTIMAHPLNVSSHIHIPTNKHTHTHWCTTHAVRLSSMLYDRAALSQPWRNRDNYTEFYILRGLRKKKWVVIRDKKLKKNCSFFGDDFTGFHETRRCVVTLSLHSFVRFFSLRCDLHLSLMMNHYRFHVVVNMALARARSAQLGEMVLLAFVRDTLWPGQHSKCWWVRWS